MKASCFLTSSFLIQTRIVTYNAAKQHKEVRILKTGLCSLSNKVVMRPQRSLLIDFVVGEQDNFIAKKHC